MPIQVGTVPSRVEELISLSVCCLAENTSIYVNSALKKTTVVLLYLFSPPLTCHPDTLMFTLNLIASYLSS